MGHKRGGFRTELANAMAAAIWEAIKAGMTEITHFEEVAILREGLGADRISDATGGLLLKRFADYTSGVCRRHKVPMKTIRFPRCVYDIKHSKWLPHKLELPVNPYNGKSILLVPHYYLDTLPTLNPDDFWNYCYDNKNELLRSEFGQDISRNVNKTAIIELAKGHPELLRKYIHKREKIRPTAYNIQQDEKGLVRWYDASKKYVDKNPQPVKIGSNRAFEEVIKSFVNAYCHYIEENNGWKLLWNDNKTSKGEEAAQLLFLGIVKHYCQANDIEISKEPNIGRGPVDFKVSHGYQYRALLELKLARNTKFWNGLRKQLPTYMHAENVKTGYFVVVLFTEEDIMRIAGIRRAVTNLNKQAGCKISAVLVDARGVQLSASQL